MTDNQVTFYKDGAATGSFTTINDALTAIGNNAGNYTIELSGTFAEDVQLKDWDGVNITFVKAEGATAAITGAVIVGNATNPSAHKGTQYAWNGNLRFEGITFDYTGATNNANRFEIRYIGTANTLEIVDCVFNGPGMINANYNAGDSTNNNGDPKGDNGGNLFGTPWGAATDGVQGKLTVTGTTFADGNINFWRNGDDWSFTGCTFTDAPVTLLGNPAEDAYDFIDCTFSLTEVEEDIAAYLVAVSENARGANIQGGTMSVAETVAGATCILSQAPNGGKVKAEITVGGTAVAISQTTKFIETKSAKETTNGGYEKDTVDSTLVASNVTGIAANNIAGAANVDVLLADGTVLSTTGDGVTAAKLTTIYVDPSFTAASAAAEGKTLGIDAFADVNAAKEVAAATDSKLVIVAGSVSDAKQLWMNNVIADGYDKAVGAENGFDVQVDGTLKGHQLIISSGKMDVSATGKIATNGTDRNFRALDATVTVTGSRTDEIIADSEILNPAGDGWGGANCIYNENIQAVIGLLKIDAGSTVKFKDTFLLIDCGVMEVGQYWSMIGTKRAASTLVIDNTQVMFANRGTYGTNTITVDNNSTVSFVNGASVKGVDGNKLNATVYAGSTLGVAGSTVTFDNITNNGTVTVSGASTVNIATLTGNAVQVLDGATITDSNIGGNVHLFGNSSLVGSNTVSGILGVGHNGTVGYATEQVVLNITGNFSAGNALIASSFDSRLNVGDADGARTTGHFGQLGAFGDVAINNADITYGYAFIRNDFTVSNSKLTINGGVNTYFSGNAKVVIDNSTWSLAGFANIGSYGGYMWGNADVILTNKSTMTATNMGIENSGNYDVKLTVKEGSSFTATKLTLTAGAEIFVDATSSITATTLTNAGVINLDAGSTITVGNMTNNGTINFTAGSTYKGGLLIDDADNTGSTYNLDNVNITVEGQSGFEAVVIDGDLYAVNKNAIYVDYSWATTTEVGTYLGEGMYYGINAFSSLEAITPALTAGPCTVYFDYAAATVAGLVVTINGEATITNYTFGDVSYNVLNGKQREHDIELVWNEENSQYEFSGAFNFSSGDFSFKEIETIVKNSNTSTVVTPDAGITEKVQIGGVSGDKSYTFSLDAISDFKYTISGIEGAGRLTLTNTTTGEVTTRLFGSDGTYVLSELGKGDYKATFEGYGYLNDEAEFTVQFEFDEILVEVLNDERANATAVAFSDTTQEITNAIGSGDGVDWFAITGMAPAADGTLVMDFDVEGVGRGSQILVNVYKVTNGKSQTIGGFVVNDTADPGEYDLRKTFYGVSAGDTIYVQVFGYGESDYTINLAPSL